MVGQKMILLEMRNRSKTIDFAQSMIMEGDTGSGKTTLALIIAALMNCKNPSMNEEGYFDPCWECAACLDIKNEVFHRDVFLFDASAMGKGAVLELQKTSNIQPMYDKNKIYIIDEAQALSKAGLGATLSLLEKKRKNIYFILCTMKPLEKSIKSRCQTYNFQKVLDLEIAKYLYSVIKQDDIDVPDEFIEKGIFLISEFSDGSVREGLQFLERCIFGKYFTTELISKELGFISKDKMIEILLLLLRKDKSVFEKLSHLDIKSFFYYSYSILVQIFKYQVTGYVDQKWKQKSYNTFKKEFDLSILINVYDKFLEITHGAYFNEKLFESYLLHYFNVSQIKEENQEKDLKDKCRQKEGINRLLNYFDIPITKEASGSRKRTPVT